MNTTDTFTVYMHVCPNGKKYIGITSKEPKKRWGRGGSGYNSNEDFHQDIRKYGWENIQHKILMENVSKETAEYWEERLIAEYGTMNPQKGYNRNSGGHHHGEVSELTREKLRKAALSRGGARCRCLETGKEFVSMSAAARSLGVNRSSINRSCSTRGRVSVKGYHFVFNKDVGEVNTQAVLKESLNWDWDW